MITIEQARKIALDMLPRSIGSNSSQRKLNKYFELDVFFKQQEKKDKLLELYQERDKIRLLVKDDEVDTVDITYYHERLIEIHQQIKTLEGELK